MNNVEIKFRQKKFFKAIYKNMGQDEYIRIFQNNTSINTEEGKSLVSKDLKILTEKAQKQNIVCEIDNGKISPFVTYVDLGNIGWKDSTEEEIIAINKFNKAANMFAQMPYEWGQEKKKYSKLNPELFKSHRGKYEQTKRNFNILSQKVMVCLVSLSI